MFEGPRPPYGCSNGSSLRSSPAYILLDQEGVQCDAPGLSHEVDEQVVVSAESVAPCVVQCVQRVHEDSLEDLLRVFVDDAQRANEDSWHFLGRRVLQQGGRARDDTVNVHVARSGLGDFQRLDVEVGRDAVQVQVVCESRLNVAEQLVLLVPVVIVE